MQKPIIRDLTTISTRSETYLSMPASDDLFRHRLGPRRLNDEVGYQVAQVEPVVEPIGEGAEVGLGVLAVLQRFEGGRHRGLEVAQHGVDPLELGQVPRLECAHHPGHMDAFGFGDCGKAPQAVTGDDGLGQQAGLGPIGNGIRREAADHVERVPNRLSGVVHRNGRHEGNFVLRASSGLAPRALLTEVGVTELHRTAEQPRRFLARHGAVDLGLAVLRCRSGSETQGSTCRTETGSDGWTSGLSFVRRTPITVSVTHYLAEPAEAGL